ncbi:hypothetical protein ACIPY3_19500 [Paenarthrobacter sp. NPDC089714]|uniref:hypothetical protein n=1 Tax=Paenarthrobacter sp. NPDC089714 TaxID=3364377 RepID=UPI00381542FD
MKNRIILRLAPVAILLAALLAPAAPAAADEPLILGKGIGCPDFNLGLESKGGILHTKEFVDKNGDIVRILTAGKGVVLTYTNYGTDPAAPVAGKSVTIRTDGSVSNATLNPDGTYTVRTSGHYGIIWFPSDVPPTPPGPATIQFIGTVVFNVDPTTGVFTFVSSSGKQRDICAELS